MYFHNLTWRMRPRIHCSGKYRHDGIEFVISEMYDVAAVYKITSKIQLLSLPVFSFLATGRQSAALHTLYSAVANVIQSGHQVLRARPRAHTAMLCANEFMPFAFNTKFQHKASRLG